MRTIAMMLGLVSLLSLGLLLMGQGGERSVIAAIVTAVLAVAAAILAHARPARDRIASESAAEHR